MLENQQNDAISGTALSRRPRADNQSGICRACFGGQLHEVVALLKDQTVHVFLVSDSSGFSQMQCACLTVHLHFTNYLGAHNASMNSSTKYGETLLCLGGNLDLVRYLAEQAGANPFYIHIENYEGIVEPAIRGAILYGHGEIVRVLLGVSNISAQVNACDRQRHTPMHWASLGPPGKVMAGLWFDHGADSSITDAEVKKALDIDLQADRLDMAGCLLAMKQTKSPGRLIGSQKAEKRSIQERHRCQEGESIFRLDVDSVDIYGQTALSRARKDENVRLASVLLTLGANVQKPHAAFFTALGIACRNNQHSLIRLLVNQGRANLNVKDCYGHTILHRMCLHGAAVEAIKVILDLNANVNCRDRGGRTPLHLACCSGHIKVVQCLLHHGATNINVTDHEGRTALHLVCGRSIFLLAQNKVTVLQSLLKHQSILVNLQDSQGCTPLHIACRWGQLKLIQLLLQHPSVHVNAKDKHGMTPLHYACFHGDFSLVEELLNCKQVNVNATDHKRQSPLHLATKQANWQVADALLNSPQHTVFVDQEDIEGWTAIMNACQHGNLKVVESLAERYQARLFCSTRDNTATPLSLACEGEHLDVIFYLIQQHHMHKYI